MHSPLAHKVAIVTGAASGIGKKIAELFAAHGATVVIADLSFAKAKVAAQEIIARDQKAIPLEMDVSNEQAVNQGIETIVKSCGSVDILVSNAGIQHIDPLDKLSYADWKKMIAVHLDGAFLTTRAALRTMYAQKKGGSIIYIGSVHSKEASVLKAPYVTAKHGLEGLCKVVAKEGAAHGVRSNLICPGFVRTPLVDEQIPQQAKKLGISEEQVVKEIMLKETVDGEFTTDEDVADAALFFAAFPTNALTGQSLVVSHGWFMQ
jgi:3-hydroxybutyrate dehydrogenase